MLDGTYIIGILDIKHRGRGERPDLARGCLTLVWEPW